MMNIPYTRTGCGSPAGRSAPTARVRQLRPIAFYGSKDGHLHQGATVHVAIAAWPWGACTGEDGLESIASNKSPSPSPVNVTMPRAKLASTYANSILASRKSHRSRLRRALLLDTNGLRGRRRENLFVIRTVAIYRPGSRSPASAHP